MSEAAGIIQGELILRVAFERRLRHDFDPVCPVRFRERLFAAVRTVSTVKGLQRKVRRKDSREEACFSHNAANHSRQAQSDDAPVIAGRSTASRLPTIPPFATVGIFALDETRL